MFQYALDIIPHFGELDSQHERKFRIQEFFRIFQEIIITKMEFSTCSGLLLLVLMQGTDHLQKRHTVTAGYQFPIALFALIFIGDPAVFPNSLRSQQFNKRILF